jgi:hypothetical protein
VKLFLSIIFLLSTLSSHAIAQVVSRWLPTAAARVPAWVRSCRICDGQSGTGTGFLRVLQSPLPIFIPPIAPQSPSSIIWGWYNGPVVATVPSELSLTPLRVIIKKVHLVLLSSPYIAPCIGIPRLLGNMLPEV